MDTFRVNAAVVPRQEQQAFIPIYPKPRSPPPLPRQADAYTP
jgi:hypothetical protein